MQLVKLQEVIFRSCECVVVLCGHADNRLRSKTSDSKDIRHEKRPIYMFNMRKYIHQYVQEARLRLKQHMCCHCRLELALLDTDRQELLLTSHAKLCYLSQFCRDCQRIYCSEIDNQYSKRIGPHGLSLCNRQFLLLHLDRH